LASFQALFPDGRIDNPDLDVFQILAGEQKVGTAIFGIRRDKRRPYGYIWEIVIDPPHRRQGYAAQTMRLLEAHSRSLGLERIGLNVFGHNGAAIALYRKLGYEPESMILRKDLPAAGPT
jgi:ribosomal protein S18 acetylase RimI-like enzyme